MTGEKLAMFGGSRAVPPERASKELVGWPVITDAEREAVVGVLDSGQFTSNNPGAGQVQLLEREWAALVGTTHCAAVSNGTTALELALTAAGIEPGAEILVPAFSFIASAVAPANRLVVPVFVDIDPVTFTMDPRAAAAAITPRTAAILAVHLHGLPCDMAELRELADRHGLLLVEDAAQSHAARYRGVRTGALGDIAAFSLNVVKNLPTCGEGGLITTNNDALHSRLLRLRQFGEVLEGRVKRDYVSHELAGNAKLSAVQAAFARCQLDRLEDYHEARDRNVRAMLDRLAALPGLRVPHCPEDRTHAWHILRFRFDAEAMGIEGVTPGGLRAAIERVMRAEGVPLQQYQRVPLPRQKALLTREGFGGYPWKLHPGAYEKEEEFPNTLAVIEDSLTLQRWHLNPASGPVLQDCAAAFEKVWGNLDRVATLARAMSPATAEAAR
ncbi:DegT/DnrJ/EryC1/StrS family aminotransferase [Streptomyces sp. NPDC044571]|uniref:DegT/DnrJ/EryC1/StrS family aminotransferase n=1 Tax=Streptomyces sp. NPDC044571 TaxID=3155371 RepID=UPI0033E9CDB9